MKILEIEAGDRAKDVLRLFSYDPDKMVKAVEAQTKIAVKEKRIARSQAAAILDEYKRPSTRTRTWTSRSDDGSRGLPVAPVSRSARSPSNPEGKVEGPGNLATKPGASRYIAHSDRSVEGIPEEGQTACGRVEGPWEDGRKRVERRIRAPRRISSSP